jgi:zinc protease
VGYIRPGASHPDFIALDVLQSILGDGVNSRLYQALVDKGLATNASAFNFTLRDPYPLILFATNAPGKSHGDVEAAIKATVADVIEKGVTAEEVKRAQQQIEVSVVRSRDGTYQFTSALGEAVASTDWKWFLTYVERIKAVTPQDIQRVAAAYLVPDHATVGWFVPTPDAKNTPPMAEAVPVVTPPETKATLSPALSQGRGSVSIPKSFAQRTLRKVLANGVVVDVIENHTVPTVAVRAMVFAGDSSAPAGKPALPGLAGNMLARGTKSRTKEQIGALLDDVGATHSYLVAQNQVVAQAGGMARNLPLMLDILSDEMSNPAFGAEELAKARKELENAYLQADDNTSARAQERLWQLIYAKDHPYYPKGRAAMVANLGALTEGDLRDFHRARYNGASTLIAVVGDVDAAKTIALVEKHFGAMARGERYSNARVATTTPVAASRETITLHGKANMNIMLGAASGLRRTDPDFEASLVANAALGQTALSSRLGKRVRDTEGLTYQIYSRFTQSDEIDGAWFANVFVAPQNLAKALKSTQDVIATYAREGATDAEVEAQKSFFAGNFKVGLGTNGGVADALMVGEKFGYGPKYLDEYPVRINAVTTAQANAAMRKHFAADKLNLIVAGDLEKLPE